MKMWKTKGPNRYPSRFLTLAILAALVGCTPNKIDTKGPTRGRPDGTDKYFSGIQDVTLLNLAKSALKAFGWSPIEESIELDKSTSQLQLSAVVSGEPLSFSDGLAIPIRSVSVVPEEGAPPVNSTDLVKKFEAAVKDYAESFVVVKDLNDLSPSYAAGETLVGKNVAFFNLNSLAVVNENSTNNFLSAIRALGGPSGKKIVFLPESSAKQKPQLVEERGEACTLPENQSGYTCGGSSRCCAKGDACIKATFHNVLHYRCNPNPEKLTTQNLGEACNALTNNCKFPLECVLDAKGVAKCAMGPLNNKCGGSTPSPCASTCCSSFEVCRVYTEKNTTYSKCEAACSPTLTVTNPTGGFTNGVGPIACKVEEGKGCGTNGLCNAYCKVNEYYCRIDKLGKVSSECCNPQSESCTPEGCKPIPDPFPFKIPIGDTCAMNEQCLSGYCVGGYCATAPDMNVPLSPVGGLCASSAHCSSGNCLNGICKGVEVGGACASDSQCDSHRCLFGACSASAPLLGIGSPCLLNAQCISGRCENAACVPKDMMNLYPAP